MGNDRPERSEVFMRRVTFIGFATLVVGMMAGCSGGSIGEVTTQPEVTDPGPADDAVALIIDARDDVHTVGRIHTADGDFTFSATISGEGRLNVTFNVNGKQFDAVVDGATTIIDGHDAVLTDADKTLLDTFARAFATKLEGNTQFIPDKAIYRWAAFLATAPANYVHKRIETVDQPEVLASGAAAGTTRIFGQEGKKCIKSGTTELADYSAPTQAWGGPLDAGPSPTVTTCANPKGGTQNCISEPVVVGSNWGKIHPRKTATTWDTTKWSDYSCMGKCGAGCNGIGGGWTKDCLDHDTCSYRYSSYGGSADTYCGDEFTAASDDIFTCM
jgi:hypothetical protein